jgi:hypothetical protein
VSPRDESVVENPEGRFAGAMLVLILLSVVDADVVFDRIFAVRVRIVSAQPTF